MAAGTVNGQVYSYAQIKLVLPGGMPHYLENIDYNDEVEREVITKTNGLPGGVVEGEYKGTVKFKMSLSDAKTFENSLAASGGVYGALVPIQATVKYGDAGQVPLTDRLQFVINKRTLSNSKGTDALAREFEGPLTAPIEHDGVPVITRI